MSMKFTKKNSIELARKGIELRRVAIKTTKSTKLGIVYNQGVYSICSNDEYKATEGVKKALVDTRYTDTIKEMSELIYKTIREV